MGGVTWSCSSKENFSLWKFSSDNLLDDAGFLWSHERCLGTKCTIKQFQINIWMCQVILLLNETA